MPSPHWAYCEHCRNRNEFHVLQYILEKAQSLSVTVSMWCLPTAGTWGSLLLECRTVLEVWAKIPCKTFHHSAVPHSTEPQLTWLCIYPAKRQFGLYKLSPCMLSSSSVTAQFLCHTPSLPPFSCWETQISLLRAPHGIFHLCRYIKNPYPMFTGCLQKEATECVPDTPHLSLSLEELSQADKR